MSQQSSIPSPSNPAYINEDTHKFLLAILRPTRVTYKSPQEDFIRNEVLKEIEVIIKSCIKPLPQ